MASHPFYMFLDLDPPRFGPDSRGRGGREYDEADLRGLIRHFDFLCVVRCDVPAASQRSRAGCPRTGALATAWAEPVVGLDEGWGAGRVHGVPRPTTYLPPPCHTQREEEIWGWALHCTRYGFPGDDVILTGWIAQGGLVTRRQSFPSAPGPEPKTGLGTGVGSGARFESRGGPWVRPVNYRRSVRRRSGGEICVEITRPGVYLC